MYPAFEAKAGTGFQPDPIVLAEMAAHHEELARAGILPDAHGLQAGRRGWRVRHDGERCAVIDGPFIEVKELIAGYTLIQVQWREEALEWARRFPNPAGQGQPAGIEVRQLFELDDFAPSGDGRAFPRAGSVEIVAGMSMSRVLARRIGRVRHAHPWPAIHRRVP